MIDCRQSNEPLVRLEEWYSSTLGKELAVREARSLERMLRDSFGYYLLQVGVSAGFADALGTSRIRHRILLPASMRPHTLGTQVVARPDHLPIAADSVDVVILPHTLEFARDARQVLRETERVLIAEGRVVIIGFNALSLWGLGRLLRRRRGSVPWCGNFLTVFRIIDWLSVLGFDVEMQEMMMFLPPWRRALTQRFSFVDTVGGRLWPLFGGVYAIRAVKRVSTMTPLRPSWRRRRPLLQGGAVEPTTREIGRVCDR